VSDVEKLVIKARELGMTMCLKVDIDRVVVSDWVPWKCRYGCKYYSKKLSCPPYSPKPEEMRKLLVGYTDALLVKGKASWQIRYAVGELEREAFLLGLHKAFALGAGPCTLCKSCVVSSQTPSTSDSPLENEQKSLESCRHPELVRPSMEACGIDVFETVRNMGCAITWSGTNTKDADKNANPADIFGLILLK